MTEREIEQSVCAHAAVWTTGGGLSLPEWQQGCCGRCNAYAVYHDGEWHYNDPPPRVLELYAEVEQLRQCLAVAAPPEGGPVVAVPVSTLETVSAENERLRDALLLASDDLYKAANQCEGMYQSMRAMEGVENATGSLSAQRFREKAERARAASMPNISGQQEDADNA